MCIGNRNLTWMLMFLSGVICNQWKVEFPQLNIAAVKGSSVDIPCSFHHPDNLRPQKVMWGRVKYHQVKAQFIFAAPVKSRFQYIGDSYRNCSLKIRRVRCEDTGKYSIRFITNNKKDYPAAPSIPTLKVVDLKVELKGNKTITEGQSANLTCINSCYRDVSSAFVWFKNGEALKDGAALYLSNVSHTSSGNYTCSLKTHTRAKSGIVRINVEYAPKNTSASIRPSAHVYAGTTLVCSSHANPLVEAHTWFKTADGGSQVVGHDPVFTPGDSGRYFCSVTNKHGTQNSSIVTVNTTIFQTTLSRLILILTTVVVLLTAAAAVIIHIRLIGTRTGVAQNTVNCPEFTSTQQQERSQSEEETAEIVYTAVYFSSDRNMEQHTASHDDDDDGTVIYSVVCRNQILNASYIDLSERGDLF